MCEPRLQAKARAAGVTAAELANALHLKSRARAHGCLLAGDWQGFLDEFNAPFKVEALGRLYEYGGAKPFVAERFRSDVSEPTRYIFTRSGGHSDRRFWLWALAALRRSGQSMMSEREREAFDQLPSTIRIFRGITVPAGADPLERAKGFWWSMDRDFALWWAAATAPCGVPHLAVADTPKADIFGFLSGHYVPSIIADPTQLSDIAVELITDTRHLAWPPIPRRSSLAARTTSYGHTGAHGARPTSCGPPFPPPACRQRPEAP